MHSEHDLDAPKTESFTGRDILYREGTIGAVDVQRAADALLRQGRKPSVAAVREHLGGGSPNTITPLLAKYWEKLGSRLGDGPESLERVPEALARVTELLWRRALEEARERLTHLARLSMEREGLRAERGKLLALLKSTQTLLEHQNSRVISLESARRDALPRVKRQTKKKTKAAPKSKPTRGGNRVTRWRRRSAASRSKRRKSS
jgi:hypothetical protein